MGTCLSLDQEELKARARSAEIDRRIQTWAKEESNTIKILLLGKGHHRKIIFRHIFNIKCNGAISV